MPFLRFHLFILGKPSHAQLPAFNPDFAKGRNAIAASLLCRKTTPLETQVPTDFLSSQRSFPHAIARGLSQAESPGILPLSASHLHPGSDSQRAPAPVVRQTPLSTLTLSRSRERCLGITVPPSFNAAPRPGGTAALRGAVSHTAPQQEKFYASLSASLCL